MHVDEQAIIQDFLDNNKNLVEAYRARHYYGCLECKEWFDSRFDISASGVATMGYCDECAERGKREEQSEPPDRERNETKE